MIGCFDLIVELLSNHLTQARTSTSKFHTTTFKITLKEKNCLCQLLLATDLDF